MKKSKQYYESLSNDHEDTYLSCIPLYALTVPLFLADIFTSWKLRSADYALIGAILFNTVTILYHVYKAKKYKNK